MAMPRSYSPAFLAHVNLPNLRALIVALKANDASKAAKLLNTAFDWGESINPDYWNRVCDDLEHHAKHTPEAPIPVVKALLSSFEALERRIVENYREELLHALRFVEPSDAVDGLLKAGWVKTPTWPE